MIFPLHSYSQGLFESALSGDTESPGSGSLSIGGFIRSSVYIGENQEIDKTYLQSAYGQASLILDARISSRATARSEIRFRTGNEFGQSVREMDIREVYADLSFGPVSLRMGKRINTWGKGTFFNPTGKITPLDPTVRIPEEDEIYLGSWGIDARVRLGNKMRFSASWNPLYRSSILLIDPVPLPGYVRFTEPLSPGTSLDQGSYGLKYDIYSSLVDASIYWFDGYHHWPGIGLTDFMLDTATMQPMLLELRETPYRIRMAGLDFSLPLNAWILRAEGAWQQSRDEPGENGIIPFPEISCTAELEYNAGTLTLLGGYYGKYILDYTEPVAEPALSVDAEQFMRLMQQSPVPDPSNLAGMIRQQLGSFNRLYNYQMEEVYHSLFLLASIQLFHEQVEIRAPAVWNLTTDEWNLHPGITFAPSDGIKISGGFSGFFGPGGSLYDLVGPPLNAGYLSVKITF